MVFSQVTLTQADFSFRFEKSRHEYSFILPCISNTEITYDIREDDISRYFPINSKTNRIYRYRSMFVMCITESKVLVNLELRIRSLKIDPGKIAFELRKNKAVFCEKMKFSRTKRDTFTCHYFITTYRSSFMFFADTPIDGFFSTKNLKQFALIDGNLRSKSKKPCDEDITSGLWTTVDQKIIEDCIWTAGDIYEDTNFSIISNFV
jgi:hypothetical protein